MEPRRGTMGGDQVAALVSGTACKGADGRPLGRGGMAGWNGVPGLSGRGTP